MAGQRRAISSRGRRSTAFFAIVTAVSPSSDSKALSGSIRATIGDFWSGTEKTAQISVFGERHEVFAEHRLVVAGTPTKFVTHVTDLKTLEPRREGPVRFQMRLGQEPPIEQTEKAPARAGIYEPMLTFPKAGEWSVALVVPTEEGEKTIAFPSGLHASGPP